MGKPKVLLFKSFRTYFIFLLFSFSVEATQANLCSQLFQSETASIEVVKKQLDFEMAHIDQTLKELEIDANDIVMGQFIGAGISGKVYSVKYRRKEYALKLMAGPSPNENMKYNSSEVREAIIMQKALGAMNVAPKVIGIIPGSQLMGRYTNGVGLLMELVDITRQLKNGQNFEITRAAYETSLREAREIAGILKALEIKDSDFDAVVAVDGKIKLIDIAVYSYRKGTVDVEKFVEQVIFYFNLWAKIKG